MTTDVEVVHTAVPERISIERDARHSYNYDYFAVKLDEYLDLCKDTVEEFHKTRGEKSDSFDRVITVNLPTIQGFARYCDTAYSTVKKYIKEKPEMAALLSRLKMIQHDRLVNGGLSGAYNPVIAKMILTHVHGYRENVDITSKGKALPQPILYALHNNNGDQEGGKSQEEN